MRGLIASLGVLALAGCLSAPVPAPQTTGMRKADVPMSSVAAFDPVAFSGRWYEVETYLPAGASCRVGAITFTAQTSGDMTVTEGPCSDGAPRRGLATRVGPGRFAFGGETYWVLWVDHEYRTAIWATPEGRAHILSRDITARADKLTAAREILAWNGFDVTRLQAARRR